MTYGRYPKRYSRRPYKKRNYRMTRYKRKDNFDIARQAWRGVLQLKRLVNAEYKYHFNTEAAITNSISWGIRNLSGIAQGDTSETRDGNSVKPLNLTVKLEFRNTIATIGTTWHRIIVLRGKNENQLGTTDYLTAYEDGAAGILDILRFKEQTGRYNSKTLHDKMYKLEATNADGPISSSFTEFNIKLDGHINFNDTSTAPESGGLYMLFVTNNTEGSMIVHSKLSYTDN